MITEDYVSFEIAKLMKDKGFDDCGTSFLENGNMFPTCIVRRKKHYPAPTLQMAMKWLREVHNKHCDVGYDIDLKWFFQIIDLKETVTYDYPEIKYYHIENKIGFNSYEEAVEAALKCTLENLI